MSIDISGVEVYFRKATLTVGMGRNKPGQDEKNMLGVALYWGETGTERGFELFVFFKVDFNMCVQSC